MHTYLYKRGGGRKWEGLMGSGSFGAKDSEHPGLRPQPSPFRPKA